MAPKLPITSPNGLEALKAPPVYKLAEGAFGISIVDTHPSLQTDVFKELVNKLAWVLGSTYRVPYSNPRSPARQYALRIVQAVIRDNGYPAKIGINGFKEVD